MMLNTVSSGRDNNFNLLRMIAASAVLISHAYPIALGQRAAEPLSSLLHMSLGTLAVLTFFAISGFFISQSFERSGHIIDFWVARFLRIYPALVAALALTIFIVGPVFTTESSVVFFSQGKTLLYMPWNLSLKWLQYDLPGVFNDNPFGPAINGSLWSLFYEVACYGMVAVLGVVAITRRTSGFIAFLILYVTCYLSLKLFGKQLLDHATVANFHQVTLPFILGMAFYRFRSFIPLSFTVCAFGFVAVLLAYHSLWFTEVFVICWCYWIFCLGFLHIPLLRSYNLLGDYSYGMYIYAFPCEQICAIVWRGIVPIKLVAISFPLTLVLAVSSWHLLERWALSYRAVLGNRIKRILSFSASAIPSGA